MIVSFPVHVCVVCCAVILPTVDLSPKEFHFRTSQIHNWEGNLNFENQSYQILRWKKFSQSYLASLTHFTISVMLFWPKYSEVAACSLGLPTGKSVSALPPLPHRSVCQISIKELLSGGNPLGPLSYSEVARGLSEILTWKRGLSGPKQPEKRSWYENPTNGFFTGKTIWRFLSLKWRAPVRRGYLCKKQARGVRNTGPF